MAGKRKALLWRQAFLRALRRTGNVRAAAFEAGVDPGTAYDHRAKDPGFGAKWGKAKTAYDLRAARKPGSAHPRSGEELVLRRTRHGDKLVRAAPGRWCARVEGTFFDGLELTGCVRTAAAAAGISTAALYARREHYPEFAARWDEIVARAAQQLPGLLHTAAVVSLGPDPSTGSGQRRRGRWRLPRVNVDQAIRISRIKGAGAGEASGSGGRGGIRPRVATNAEVREALTKSLEAFGKRVRANHLAEGWTETADGHLIPPGWVFAGPPETGAGAEGGDAGDAEDRFGKSGEARDCPPGEDGEEENGTEGKRCGD